MTISWPIRGELLVYKTLEVGVEEESFLPGFLWPSFFLKGSDNIRNRGLIPFRVVVIVDGLVVVVVDGSVVVVTDGSVLVVTDGSVVVVTDGPVVVMVDGLVVVVAISLGKILLIHG